MGSTLREYLVHWVAGSTKGNADLVAYFFLRAAEISAGFGFLATNTISQGDSREVGLDQLLRNGWIVFGAVKSIPWPGAAALEVAKVWMSARQWEGPAQLNGVAVPRITSSLDQLRRVDGIPERLREASSFCFVGDALNTMGFVLEPDEAQKLLSSSSRNHDVIKPYMHGIDLNTSPVHSASRWVINFADWSEQRAGEYPECLAVVRDRVREEVRAKPASYRGWSDRWWQFWMYRAGLHQRTDGLDRVLVLTRVSKLVQPAFVPAGRIFSDATVVFAYDDDFHFGVLTSGFHWWWP